MTQHPLDVTVQLAATGADVSLRDLIGGQPALVVLTRHMDCPYCEVHVGRVIRDRDDLGRVIVVGHGTPAELREHHAGLPHEFVVVADADQALYRAFGTRRTRPGGWMMVAPWNWLTFARHLLRGGRVVRAGQDLAQLGGDAVVTSTGDVRWVHLSRRPDDRPRIEDVRDQMLDAA